MWPGAAQASARGRLAAIAAAAATTSRHDDMATNCDRARAGARTAGCGGEQEFAANGPDWVVSPRLAGGRCRPIRAPGRAVHPSHCRADARMRLK